MGATARVEYFGELLEPILGEIFYNQYDQIPSMIESLFNMQTTSNPYEDDLSLGSMGLFRKFQGSVDYDRPYVQYKKTYEFPEYADGFKIERKLYDDEMHGIMNQRPADLAEAAKRRREMDAATIFNYADQTTATDPEGETIDSTGADGRPLCDDQHPTKSPDGPTHRSNKDSLTLNHANLQTTKNKMRKFQDDRGNKISVVPDTLVVGVDLEEQGWELIQSEKKIDTAENNPNIHHGRYTLVVWDYLEDDGRWFLADSRYMRRYLKWFDRIPIEFAMKEEFDELVAKYRAYMRYEAGWSDWFFIFGNFPQ